MHPAMLQMRQTPFSSPPRYVVQWVSGSKSPQQVKWGLSSGALDSTQQSTSVTYGVTQM